MKKVIWRIGDMDKLQSLNRKIVTVTSLDDIEEKRNIAIKFIEHCGSGSSRRKKNRLGSAQGQKI